MRDRMGQRKCQIRSIVYHNNRVLINCVLFFHSQRTYNYLIDDNNTLYNSSIVLTMTTPQAVLDALESLGDAEKSKFGQERIEDRQPGVGVVVILLPLLRLKM